MAIDYKNSLSRYRRYLSNLQNESAWSASFWVGMTVLLVIAMAIFFLRPTLITISSLLGKSKEQKKLILRIDAKIGMLKQAENMFNQINDERTTLEKVLPDQPLWLELSDRLYEVASQSGVIVKDISVKDVLLDGQKILTSNETRNNPKKEEKLIDGLHKVTFSMEVRGNYEQVESCLAKVENEGRLLVINNARISKNKDGSLELSLEGYGTFYKYQAIGI